MKAMEYLHSIHKFQSISILTFVCGHQRLVTPASVAGHKVHCVVLVVISGIGTAFVDLSLDDGGGTPLSRLTTGNPLLVTFLILCHPITLEAFGSYQVKKNIIDIHSWLTINSFFFTVCKEWICCLRSQISLTTAKSALMVTLSVAWDSDGIM